MYNYATKAFDLDVCKAMLGLCNGDMDRQLKRSIRRMEWDLWIIRRKIRISSLICELKSKMRYYSRPRNIYYEVKRRIKTKWGKVADIFIN